MGYIKGTKFVKRRSIADIALEIHSKENIRLKYFLVFSAISQCGIGVYWLKYAYPVMSVILLGVLFRTSNSGKVVKVLPWVLITLVVYLFQAIIYAGSIAEDIGLEQYGIFILRHLVPFLYLVAIGEEFFKFYVKILYYYSVLSLYFLTFSILFRPFRALIHSGAMFWAGLTGTFVVDYKAISFFQLFTYTMEQSDAIFLRNAGPYWEPGAFAAYLSVALVMQYFYTGSLRNKYNIVFTIALLTTQSSAGYPALFVFYFLVVLFSRNSLKPVVLLLIAAVSITVYSYAPFMKGKISNMYESQTEQDLHGYTSGRFYAMRKSINAVKEYPVFGRGITRRTAEDEFSEFAGGYGIMNVPAKYGVFVATVYFVSLWLSLFYYASLLRFGNRSKYALLAAATLFPSMFSLTIYDSVIILIIMQSVFLYGLKKVENNPYYENKKVMAA